MRSTKGTARHYVVLNSVGKAGELYEVQRFEYIEGDKFKTRKAAFRHANDARAGWQDKVYQYRNATMTLTDTAEIPQPAPLTALRKHVTGAIQRGEAQPISAKIAPTNNWPVQS